MELAEEFEKGMAISHSLVPLASLDALSRSPSQGNKVTCVTRDSLLISVYENT